MSYSTIKLMAGSEIPDICIYVSTGDKKDAGTDANVKIKLYDNSGHSTKDIPLNNFIRNNFERGKLDNFHIVSSLLVPLTTIDKIEIWRDDTGFSSDWYVDKIVVEDRNKATVYEFPVFRWIKAHQHYRIKHLDTSLPQDDECPEQREMELQDKRKEYEYCQKIHGLPVQVRNVPKAEEFSFKYKWTIVGAKTSLIVKSKLVKYFTKKWKNIEDIKTIFHQGGFPLPKGSECWNDDLYFANQRIAGANCSIIKLCTQIPAKLAVTEEMLKPVSEGNSLEDLLKLKRIFIVDLEILSGLCNKPAVFLRKENGRDIYDYYNICVPIGLFMVDNQNQLRPIAIQLFQEPGPTNPVFLPTDHPSTWLFAKMWFNNADSTYHQALSHLAFTHLLMEGVVIATHRNFSPSHPLFKLLAPYFLNLIAINARGVENLLSPGGWVDSVMNCGVKGMFQLIRRGIDKWRLDIDGTLPEDLKNRGLFDPNVLPGYHYRDDAILLYNVIKKCTSDYIDLYYDDESKISSDWELQSWGKEIVKSRESGGVGLKGLPNNGLFKTKENIVQVVTSVIFTCSVGHSATNFPQYDEYAFPPNYPATFNGTPPTTKNPVDEKDTMESLPGKSATLDIIIVTKLLSNKNTNSIGDFEMEYIFDPKAKKVVENFQNDLKKISLIIKERNKKRKIPYPYLDPEMVPNSISI